jgi:two-component system nitrate/nitrite response regulator NarL
VPIKANEKIRVLVIDPVGMGCHLLAAALKRSGLFSVSAMVRMRDSGRIFRDGSFDIALVSTGAGDDSLKGLALLRRIRLQQPNLKCIALVDSSERETILEAFRLGTRGVFCRSDSFQSLRKCIQSVHAGQIWASTRELGFVLNALTNRPVLPANKAGLGLTLSKREEEVARFVGVGLTNREISEQLGISEHTVKNYLFRIFEKLNVSSRVELVLYAFTQAEPTKNESRRM